VSAAPFLDSVPEDVRRDAYLACCDAGVPCSAVEWTSGDAALGPRCDALAALRSLPGLTWVGIEPAAEVPALAELDPSRSFLRLRALAAGCARDVRGVLSDLPGELDVHEHDPRALAFPQGSAAAWRSLDAEAAALRRHVDGGQLLAAWEATGVVLASGAAPYQVSALRWVQVVLEAERPDAALLRSLIESARARAGAELRRVDPASEEAARLVLGAQRDMLAVPCDPDVAAGRLRAAGAAARSALRVLGDPGRAERVEEVVGASLASGSVAPLRELLGGEYAAPTERGAAADAPPARGDGPAARGEAPAARGEAADPGGRQELKVLKVDPERVDRLMELVSELVVAKNGLPFLARRAEEGLPPKRLAREIKERFAVLHRIADDLQASVMGMRMVPVSQVFRRFHRLVRDVAATLGKQIRLEVDGEDTAADKSVVEDLYEPLVHLLRNAMDHGIELPADREAAGKPPMGTIRLAATRRDDQVVIEISDDGRGIDPERIRAKAVEKGVIGAAEAAALDRDAALQLVFLPGFSTMDRASELSGRGVGMDVVRTMAARAGGTLSLDSTPGAGTRLTLSLPLTMTVSQVMVVEIGGVSFGVPFASIVETVRVAAGDVRRVGAHEVLVLRGRLVPVFRVARALDLGGSPPRDDVAILVVRMHGEDVGLCVDAFHGRVDVILKPMDGVMKGFRLFAGTTLLGDGRVLLVLDLKELVQCLSAA
jgi:two-component system chemotaxis sensor kinase CheA